MRNLGVLIFYVVALIAAASSLLADEKSITNKSSVKANKCENLKIAVDIGHYKSKLGAIDLLGRPELVYNDILVHTIIKKLKENGFTTVIVNENLELKSLSQRPKNAMCEGADLMLSIHHDMVDSVEKTNLEFLGKIVKGSKKIGGSTFLVSSLNPYFDISKKFATQISINMDRLKIPSSRKNQSYYQDNLRRLISKQHNIYDFKRLAIGRTSQIPVVLLEAAFLSNPDDIKRARTELFRQKVADAVLSSVEDICTTLPSVSQINETIDKSKC